MGADSEGQKESRVNARDVLYDKKTTKEEAQQLRFLPRLSRLFHKDVDILADADEK